MINGVWTAFPQCYDRDERALGHAITYLFHENITGLFLLGTTGQGPDFTVAERKRLAERLLRLTQSPERVIIAISANAAGHVRELLEHAWEHGVKGVALTPPYYGRFGPDELIQWVADVFRDPPPPRGGEVYLYNVPLASPTLWSLPVVSAIDKMIGVDGIKDSSGDVSQLLTYVQWSRGRDTSILVGNERLTMYHYLNGGHGVVSGLSAAAPELMVRLVRQCADAQWLQARDTQVEVNQLLDTIQGPTLRASVRNLVKLMDTNGVFAHI